MQFTSLLIDTSSVCRPRDSQQDLLEKIYTALHEEPRALEEVIELTQQQGCAPHISAVDAAIETLDDMLWAGWVEVRRGLFCLTEMGRHVAVTDMTCRTHHA